MGLKPDIVEGESMKRYRIATAVVHGAEPRQDPLTRSLTTPIYQSAVFGFKDADQGAAIFAGEEKGYFYTRLGNPTHTALEERLAFLEGGEEAVAFGSGMAAIATATLTLCRSGDRIVSSYPIYGGTHQLFKELLPRLGIEVVYVDATVFPEEARRHMNKRTRMVYLESPANPTLTLVDLARASRLAHLFGAKVVVDSTFATPYHQRPIEFGADIVVHSGTKYLGGHGDTVSGVAIGPHGFCEELRSVILRDLGGIISPFNAFLLLRGIKTLAVRMERHSENALRVAQFLEGHSKVRRVYYPGLPSHPQFELAQKQMSNGASGMVAFEVKGGREGGRRLLNHCRLCTLAVSLGSTDTLIEHPASMTHSTYSGKELRGVGISESLVRLSVGIEDVDDIIADLQAAFRKV
jgi:methionine-gamma-lyase